MLITEENLDQQYGEIKAVLFTLFYISFSVLLIGIGYDEDFRETFIFLMGYLHPYWISLALVYYCQKLRRKYGA